MDWARHGTDRVGKSAVKPRVFDAMATLASPEELQKTEVRLSRDYATLNNDSKDAVNLLLSEGKGLYDLAHDRFKALDGKAVTIIGIVTTGFGAIAILGDPTKIPAQGAWFITALLAFVGCFICALWSLLPRGAANPDPSYYLSPKTVASKDSAVRITFDLSIAWMRDAASIEHATIQKGRRLLAAVVLLFVGVTALALNYLTAKPAEKPVPTVRVLLQSAPKP
jgi:hypothetical protein